MQRPWNSNTFIHRSTWGTPNRSNTQSSFQFRNRQAHSLNRTSPHKINIAEMVFSVKSIFLLSEKYNINLLKNLPRLFLITTNNSSATFNATILSSVSPVISHFLEKNPDKLEYHFNQNDDLNVLQKIEKMFQGEDFAVTDKEIPFLRIIALELNLTCFPQKVANLIYRGQYCTKNLSTYHFFEIVNIRKICNSHILNNKKKFFTIRTKKREYKVNYFGVFSSMVIEEYIKNNPSANYYIYDFDDDREEFQSVCNLFNFIDVKLTSENAYTMYEICQDLKIDSVLSDINRFIDDIEKVSKAIDDQQNIIDTIEELFCWLYGIKEKKVEFVAEMIIDSNWSKTEENVIELASCILQVISTDIRLHSYMVDLLVKLNEDESPENELKILIPFISDRLMLSFNLNDMHIPFIYKMYKKGFIQKSILDEKLKVFNSRNPFVISWLLPELGEFNKKNFKLRGTTLIYPAESIPIEDYKKMREKGEYDDEIANALRNDDIDTFQSIVSKDVEKSLKKKIIKNMFDPFLVTNARYINYAAAYGSIKCFKYLLLNNEKIDDLTFEMAIIGGNVELIRIVDNEKLENSAAQLKFDFSVSTKQGILFKALTHSIKRHQNDIFDWILEQKSSMINQTNFLPLAITSIENNNAHTLVQLMDNGFNFYGTTERYYDFLEKSIERGYCLMTKLLLNLIDKTSNSKVNIKSSIIVSFGNLSIFKLFEKRVKPDYLESVLNCSIREKKFSFIKYYFDSIINKSFKLNSKNIKLFLSSAILYSSEEILDYLITKINEIESISLPILYDLLSTAFSSGNYQIIKKIANLIYLNNSENDITNFLLKAINSNMKEIVEFFIDNKYSIDYYSLSNTLSSIGSTNVDIFKIIMKNANSENQQTMIKCINNAIIKLNKPLIKYLIDENAPLDKSLIEAVNMDDLEIVEMILNKNSSPSYINKISSLGTALYISVKKRMEIFDKLISMPGIDPSIYFEEFETPLILSASLLSENKFNKILEFYGEKIKDQKWQIERCIKKLILNNRIDNRIENILTSIIKLNIIDLNYRFESTTLLFYAIQMRMNNLLKIFLDDDSVDFNNYEPSTGNTPLIYAIQLKNSEIAKLLIESPKVDINKVNYEGQNALYNAIITEQNKIAKFLIESEKFKLEDHDINYLFYISNGSLTKEFLSFESLDVNYTTSLPKKFQPMTFKLNGRVVEKSQLIRAIINKDNELFNLIIHHKSFCLDNEKTKMQIFAALFESIEYNSLIFFKELLKLSDKIDINLPIFEKHSLLSFTIMKITLRDEFISLILDYPTFDSKKSKITESFTFCLTNANRISTAKLLYDFDSKHDHLIDSEIVNNGANLLIKVLDSPICTSEIIQLLLDYGIDINKPSSKNEYPFIYAVKKKLISILSDKNSFESVSYLISSNKLDFNLKFKNESNETSYFHTLAKMNDSVHIIEILTDKLCDINITNDLGETPLIEACKNLHPEVVKVLFKYDDLDFKHKNNKGEDAIKILQNLLNSSNENKEDDKNEKDLNDKNEKDLNDKNDYLTTILKLIDDVKNQKNTKEQKENDENETMKELIKNVEAKKTTDEKAENQKETKNQKETGNQKETENKSDSSQSFGFNISNLSKIASSIHSKSDLNDQKKASNFYAAFSSELTKKKQKILPFGLNRNNTSSSFSNSQKQEAKEESINQSDSSDKKSDSNDKKQEVIEKSVSLSDSNNKNQREKEENDSKSDSNDQKQEVIEKSVSLSDSNNKNQREKEENVSKSDSNDQKHETFLSSSSKSDSNDQKKNEQPSFKFGFSSRNQKQEKTEKFVTQSDLSHNSNNQNEAKKSSVFVSNLPKTTKTNFVTYNESFSTDPDLNLLNFIDEFKKKSTSQKDDSKQFCKSENHEVKEVSKTEDKSMSRRKVKHLFYDEEDEIVDSFYSDQEQLAFMQQQQQMWFQMIQMNNQMQAQFYSQMMNSIPNCQINQSKKKKKRNRK